MNEKMIEMPLDLAMELLEYKARLKAIEAYTRTETYSLDKKIVAGIAGFKLEKPEENL